MKFRNIIIIIEVEIEVIKVSFPERVSNQINLVPIVTIWHREMI